MNIIYKDITADGHKEMQVSYDLTHASVVSSSGKTYLLRDVDGKLTLTATDNTGTISVRPLFSNSIEIE